MLGGGAGAWRANLGTLGPTSKNAGTFRFAHATVADTRASWGGKIRSRRPKHHPARGRARRRPHRTCRRCDSAWQAKRLGRVNGLDGLQRPHRRRDRPSSRNQLAANGHPWASMFKTVPDLQLGRRCMPPCLPSMVALSAGITSGYGISRTVDQLVCAIPAAK